MTKQSFIEQIAPAAVEDMIKTGVLASITIAQACLESAWGQSAPGNNLFGIKGSGTTQTTQEFINGKWVSIETGFRVYNDWIGSIEDHSEFLLQNSRYRKSGFFDCCTKGDYAEAARALQSAGYATDPQYAVKLIRIIEGNNLNNYDQEADSMLEIIKGLQDQILDLQGQCLTLLNTAEAHIEKINVLEDQHCMPVPDWVKPAVDAAVRCNLIDSPDGRSHDFYSLLTVFHRKGII
ncbi:glycoside hydrolase family 73 protein [Bacillus sp. 3255]|uniref:glycoside hydrolase family 73 protein n=1 Tax=Bacillus sp. 3255 TaxID=2817904 RepID=UPI0028600457|nr:glycoside hydrolase family 73 protein [Bacillus sp. 3255]MDR6880372.1 hypothetical protein [Bacillus sp. 3255]